MYIKLEEEKRTFDKSFGVYIQHIVRVVFHFFSFPLSSIVFSTAASLDSFLILRCVALLTLAIYQKPAPEERHCYVNFFFLALFFCVLPYLF